MYKILVSPFLGVIYKRRVIFKLKKAYCNLKLEKIKVKRSKIVGNCKSFADRAK